MAKSPSAPQHARFDDIALYLDPDVTHPRPRRVLCLDERLHSPTHAEPSEAGVARALGGGTVRLDQVRAYDLLSRALPRGIPWTQFPITSAPYYRLGRDGSRRWTVDGGGPDNFEPHLIARHFDGFDAFLVSGRAADDLCHDAQLYRYYAGYVLDRLLAHGDSRPILVPDGLGGLVGSTPGQLMAPASTHLAFHYSYQVNFAVIAAKAWRVALGESSQACPRSPMDSAGLDSPRDPRARSLALHQCAEWQTAHHAGLVPPWPLGIGAPDPDNTIVARMAAPDVLQVLYAVRRVVVSPNPDATPWRLDCIDDVGSGDAWWTGTGKHPRVAMPRGHYNDILRILRDSGAIESVWSTRVHAITPRGHKFLDLLHPDCEDPDIMCRWRQGGDPLIGAEFAVQSQAWTRTFFRKMKTAANRIGAPNPDSAGKLDNAVSPPPP